MVKHILILVQTCIGTATGPLFSETVFSDTCTPRRVINLNTHWLFTPVDLPDGMSYSLDENDFQPVCLPHSNAIVPHNNIDMRSFRNVSWYRRHFSPPAAYRGRRFIVTFQGASQVTEVFVNGKKAGRHRGAYTPFSCEISDFVRFGSDNVIAVRVDARRHREIPPEGSLIDYMLFGGITRDVTMTITGPTRIEWVFASRDSTDPSRLNVRCRIENGDTSGRNYVIVSELVDSAGRGVATGSGTGSAGPDSSLECAYTTGPVNDLHEWDIAHPYLYTLHTRVLVDSNVVDVSSEKIGVRSISFSKTDGRFYLNGTPIRLSGLNRHETFPFIGRAAANRLQKKDADILKFDLGCNIVRCSHYPQDPEFLSRCDEIGLLVLEEIPGWSYVGKSEWQQIALRNVEEMVMRDRNHPSVISYGVRINQSHDYHDLYVKTNRLSRRLDPTRPTHGVRLKGRYSTDEFLEDIWTHNFTIPAGRPKFLPWLITESFGVGCQVHSWDEEEKLIGMMLRFAEVMDSAAANPFIAGQIGWCAFDYNSSHKTADRTVCYYGASDIYRIPKHAGFFLQSQAGPEVNGHMVYIAHSWKKKLSPNDVWVAGNCDRVELFVNQKSLGKKTPDRYRSLPYPLAVWKNVAFKPPGKIKAVGYVGDSAVAVHVRRTPGRPVALRIIPDDTLLVEGGDMTRVVVNATDRYGQTVPKAKNVVSLSVSGAADLIGQELIALEDGKTAFFVKTRSDETGTVMCRAEGKGLAAANAQLTVWADPQASSRIKILGQ